MFLKQDHTGEVEPAENQQIKQMLYKELEKFMLRKREDQILRYSVEDESFVVPKDWTI